MNRRELLWKTGAAALGLSAFPLRWAAADAAKAKQRVLYFTRSAGFVHSVVKRKGSELAWSEKILTELGRDAGFDVECRQDEEAFDGDLAKYDLIAFYTSGKVLSDARKEKLLSAINAGKPFVGIHAATDSFRSGGIDPYIAMIGGEFSGHGAQQATPMKIVSPKFPGVEGLGESFAFQEEWYAFQKFAADLHVILVQDTTNMQGPLYQRPSFPATWARMQGKGRVFYTSMGHREDVWTNKKFQQVLLGGIAWGLGNAQADVKPNMDAVTPGANQAPAKRPAKKK